MSSKTLRLVIYWQYDIGIEQLKESHGRCDVPELGRAGLSWEARWGLVRPYGFRHRLCIQRCQGGSRLSKRRFTGGDLTSKSLCWLRFEAAAPGWVELLRVGLAGLWSEEDLRLEVWIEKVI